MYPIFKKLSNKQQLFLDVVTVVSMVLDSKKGKDIRVLQPLLSFAEYQFGKEVLGKRYRERDNGERLYNWRTDIVILQHINRIFVATYREDNFLGYMTCNDKMLYHLERSLLG